MPIVRLSPGGWFSFPNPVNEKAARVVAGLVVLSVVAAMVTGMGWIMWLVAVGFGLRVMSGPRFSPFGLLATRVVAPRLGPAKLVAGPPKRFAQGVGLVVSLASAAFLTWGAATPGWVLAGVLVVAATLESAFAVCLGCITFGWLQRAGLVPQSVCDACNNIAVRQPVV